MKSQYSTVFHGSEGECFFKVRAHKAILKRGIDCIECTSTFYARRKKKILSSLAYGNAMKFFLVNHRYPSVITVFQYYQNIVAIYSVFSSKLIPSTVLPSYFSRCNIFPFFFLLLPFQTFIWLSIYFLT